MKRERKRAKIDEEKGSTWSGGDQRDVPRRALDKVGTVEEGKPSSLSGSTPDLKRKDVPTERRFGKDRWILLLDRWTMREEEFGSHLVHHGSTFHTTRMAGLEPTVERSHVHMA